MAAGMAFLLVFLGAGAGGVLRYGVSLAPYLSGRAGWATLVVNIAGSFVMGYAGAYLARSGASEAWRLFLLAGVLGGFTTFSAFSADAMALIARGAMGAAFTYVATSVLASLAAIAVGAWLARGG